MKDRVELLAPCGNFDCVKAAVNAGADAVYLGGRAFGARAYAANFDHSELEDVCSLCHSFGVKVYVTVNTLYKDEEFAELSAFIDELYVMGVDGLIMQDLGAIRMVRQNWPDLPVHASTQLTANSLADVKELEALGLKTVVLSRELNLKEIRNIAASTSVRIETFIHGALCVSYSGQCLMSSVLGNRSGNRGKCAQNCRLKYELRQGITVLAEGHLLSTKDICTLPLLPELVKSGVASLKIEGRMKSPEYVAGVTGIYRKYLDLIESAQPYVIDPKDIENLNQLFNRGAFSEGYLRTHSGLDMMCPVHPKHWGVPAGKVLSYDRKKQTALIRFEKSMTAGDGIEIRTDEEEGTGCYLNKACDAHQKVIVPVHGNVREGQAVYRTYDKRLMDMLKPRYETVTRKVPMEMSVVLHRGSPSELMVSAGGKSVTVCGAVPEPAQSQPLTAENVAAQIGKLGNTIYHAGSIHTDVENGLYLNKSELNTLKNNAAGLLREKILNSSKRSSRLFRLQENIKETDPGSKSLSAEIRTSEQFRAVLNSAAVSVIYLDLSGSLMKDLKEITGKAHEAGKKVFVKLPRIWREYVQKNFFEGLSACTENDVDGFLISNPGHYHAVKDSGKAFSLDFTANVMNRRSFDFWRSLGAERIAVSVEMSGSEINALPDHAAAELLAYGYLPLMVTHQCPVGNFAGQKKDRMHCRLRGHSEGYSLHTPADDFRLETDCRNCICTITTAEPIDIADVINTFNIKTIRLNFTDESFEKISEILRKYESALENRLKKISGQASIYDKAVL